MLLKKANINKKKSITLINKVTNEKKKKTTVKKAKSKKEISAFKMKKNKYISARWKKGVNVENVWFLQEKTERESGGNFSGSVATQRRYEEIDPWPLTSIEHWLRIEQQTAVISCFIQLSNPGESLITVRLGAEAKGSD